MSEDRKRGGHIGQAWLVICLSLLYGGALAGVQTVLSDRIAENKRTETYEVIPQLVAGADKSKTAELGVVGKDGKEARVYKVLGTDGGHLGWVLPAGGQGFADRIELLIGVDRDLSAITGIYVLDQRETPGLGDYITSEAFRERFRGRPTDPPLVVVKADPKAQNEIQALTGATISSESVSGVVNAALANLRDPIRAQTAAGGPPARVGAPPRDEGGEY